MKITTSKSYPIDARVKIRVFVRMITDEGLSGLDEAMINGFAEAAIGGVRDGDGAILGPAPWAATTVAWRAIDASHRHRVAMAVFAPACCRLNVCPEDEVRFERSATDPRRRRGERRGPGPA